MGRFEVLDMTLSISLSITILNAFAAPAASVPPIKVARVISRAGMPSAARKSAGSVVTNKSSTTLNFINAI